MLVKPFTRSPSVMDEIETVKVVNEEKLPGLCEYLGGNFTNATVEGALLPSCIVQKGLSPQALNFSPKYN